MIIEDQEEYIFYLETCGFNEGQIKLILEQQKNYQLLKETEYFDIDHYERDLWFVMNRSGLFEKEESNKSGIYNWDVNDTRLYITEV